jgi:hypothetical protein
MKLNLQRGSRWEVKMTGIPTINFDFFNLAEIPTFTLCNPNKEKLYALGGISERKYSPRYNSISELSFRADEYIDEVLMPYYQYITNRRLVYVDDIGYFMITDVTENNDGIVKYKEVGCQSLEVELSSRKLTGFVSGSGIWEGDVLISNTPIPLTLEQFYAEISQYLAGWTFDGNIPTTIIGKYRSFDVSDTTIYNLLMADVEEAYGCIFEYDTVNDIIFIRDAEDETELTDIFISHDNVIESMTVEEVTDELATCLYVVGGGNLGINWINPLANNYIYNFQYFKSTEWMEQSLIDSITAWEYKFTNASPVYAAEVLEYFEDYDHWTTDYTEWEIISGSARHDQTQYETSASAGVDINTPEMQALLASYTQLWAEADALADHMLDTNTLIEGHFNAISASANSLKLDNIENFSLVQQNQLQPFIIQSSYVNDNIIVTEYMTSSSMLMQQESLYNQGKSILERVSAPRYNFEVDSVSFLQIKDLQTFGSQLSLGKRITLEIKPGLYLLPILLGVDIDFDNPTNFKLIFGNRLRLNDESFQFNDLMTKALSAGTSINLNSQAFNDWTRDYKSQYQTLASGVNVNSITSAAGIDVNPSNATEIGITPSTINLKATNLLWNGVPLSLVGGGGGGGGGTGITNIMITLFSGGESISMHEPTAAGLNGAIAASSSGDVIFMPDVDITGDFSIPAGVNLVGVSSLQSIIRGQVTIEPGCLLENLSVINQQNSSDLIVAVLTQESTTSEETCNIKGCDIRCYQCGSGNTYAVYIADSGVELVVENSTIIADSNSGLGYAFSNNGGDCRVYHSQYYAKTEVFYGV